MKGNDVCLAKDFFTFQNFKTLWANTTCDLRTKLKEQFNEFGLGLDKNKFILQRNNAGSHRKVIFIASIKD